MGDFLDVGSGNKRSHLSRIGRKMQVHEMASFGNAAFAQATRAAQAQAKFTYLMSFQNRLSTVNFPLFQKADFRLPLRRDPSIGNSAPVS
jgi:hypothetical protein